MKFKKPVVRVSGSCEVFVQGVEMACPLCTTLVRSGELHRCKVGDVSPAAGRAESGAPRRRPKR